MSDIEIFQYERCQMNKKGTPRHIWPGRTCKAGASSTSHPDRAEACLH